MTTTLQEAIAAARAGESGRAQLLAAEVVRENPGDANGWYLLSQLVDSDARRAAYLSKALAVDPDHPRAQAEFAALPPTLTGELAAPVAAVVAVEATSPRKKQRRKSRGRAPAAAAVEAASEPTVDEPIADSVQEMAIAPQEAEVAEIAAVASAEAPDWPQPLEPETVSAAIPATEPIEDELLAPAPPPPPRTYAAPPKKKDNSNRALSIMLGLMVLLTVVVIAFLVYLLFF